MIEDIDQLFNGTELKTLDKLQEMKIKINRKTYTNLKKEVCKLNEDTIKDNILKRINKYPEQNINDCFFDEKEEVYEIYIDETLKNKKAGYTVFCKLNSKNNYSSKVKEKQTL